MAVTTIDKNTDLDEVRWMALDGGVYPQYQIEDRKAMSAGITLSIAERKAKIRRLIAEKGKQND